jgi:hypothetical protein
MSSERPATVFAATFVPSKSPIPEFGQEGYSVAWVDTAEGREQVLVSGTRPAPGSTGRVVMTVLGDSDVALFVADSV